MANTVLGKVCPVPRGDYSATETYYALDIVGYQGGSYLAMQEVTGVTPSNDQTNWMQLSGPGLPGEDGTDGVDGQTPDITIGSVTTLEPGQDATASIVGETPNLTLSLGIPQGEPGAAAGFGEVSATVDDTTGTPSVDVQTSGPDTAKVISFAFSGLKGSTGDKGDTGDTGPQGAPGAAAGFGTPTATVDDNVGTPGVTVTASGPDTAKVFAFQFVNLKGETGDQGVQGVKGDPGTSVSRIERTSGTGAAGTTDTYTMYDSDDAPIGTFTVYNGSNGTGSGDFMANGTVPMTGALNMGGQKVTNVGAPTDPTDAVRQSDLEAISDEIDHILDGTTPVTVPVATEIKAGIVKPGEGMSVTEDGTLNVDEQLPTGGTAGQVLTKTEDGEAWQDAPDGLPEGGTTGQILTKTSDGAEWADAPDTGVTTFNGRSGAVTPQTGDYTAEMVGARPSTWTPSADDVGAVPTARTVNGKALSADITLDAEDVGAIPASQKGAASGVAELDSTGRVPSAQLPSYVDDVIEVTSYSALPNPGEDGKIYITEDTNLQYRWSGTQYVEISPSLALGETASTAYRGDRGKTAYDHSQTTGNPHETTAAEVGAMPAVSGGSTGQVLTKTDDGQAWQDAPETGMSQDDADARYLKLSGGTMTGHVDFANGKGAAFFPNGSSNVNEAVLLVAYKPENGIACLGIEGKYGLAQARVKSVADPIDDFDAANKAYVDSKGPKTATVTLTTDGWRKGEQTVTVTGILADSSAQIVDVCPANKPSADRWAAAGVWCTSQAANSLTFSCDSVPTEDINVNIRMQGVSA